MQGFQIQIQNLCGLQVNDGSNLSGIQVVLEQGGPGFELVDSGKIQTGAAVRATGSLVESIGAKQAVELKASSVELVGECDPETYPLQVRTITHIGGALEQLPHRLLACFRWFFTSYVARSLLRNVTGKLTSPACQPGFYILISPLSS